VILKKITSEEMKSELADVLRDGAAGVAFDFSFGRAEQESGAIFISGRVLKNVFSLGGEGFVDFVHRDGAMGDIDNARTAVEFKKADSGTFARFWLLKVGRQLRAVCVLAWGGDGGLDGVIAASHVL